MREEVSGAFPEADEDEIEDAVDQIMDGTFDWAPNGNRIQPDDYEEPVRPPLGEQLAALAGQLDQILTTCRRARRIAMRAGSSGWNRTQPTAFRTG